MKTLKYFKLNPTVIPPTYATPGSACFDLHVNLTSNPVTGYDQYNNPIQEIPKLIGGMLMLHLPCRSRMLVPTGLILDIPENHSVRLHVRSGVCLKSGLQLANCEGVIDSDYVEPLYIIVHNTSGDRVTLINGDRICQGELVVNEQVDLLEITSKVDLKTKRVGGFGSTGK